MQTRSETLAGECKQVSMDDLPSGVSSAEMQERVAELNRLLRVYVQVVWSE